MMYKYQRRAHFHESDQMGVIHHSNYIKWMEEARIGLMDSIGYTYKMAEEEGTSSPTVAINIEYKKFVKSDDVVEISVGVEKYTGISVIFSYEFVNLSTGELTTIATSRHCFIDGEGKVISLKKRLPKLDEAMKNYIQETTKEKQE